MNKKQIVHVALGAAAVVAGILISAMHDPSVPWVMRHAHWAAIIIALATNLRTIIDAGTPLTGLSIAGILALALGVSGCAHVPTPAPDCKTAAVALLGELASALIQENWANAVEALVTDPHGGLCAVEEGLGIISKQSASNAAASGDNLEALKARRAKLWLAEHGGTAP
jgi:hypothetical protein